MSGVPPAVTLQKLELSVCVLLNQISLTFSMVTFAGMPKFSYWDFRAAAFSVSVLSLKKTFYVLSLGRVRVGEGECRHTCEVGGRCLRLVLPSTMLETQSHFIHHSVPPCWMFYVLSGILLSLLLISPLESLNERLLNKFNFSGMHLSYFLL